VRARLGAISLDLTRVCAAKPLKNRGDIDKMPTHADPTSAGRAWDSGGRQARFDHIFYLTKNAVCFTA
jgi:hypothetical protein